METQKPCTKCGQTKPLVDFSKAPRGKHGVKSTCKECDAARHRLNHPPTGAPKGRPRRVPHDPASLKLCTRCGEEKPRSEFSLSRQATSTQNAVYRSQCKRCQAEQARKWFSENTERSNESRRRFNLANLYGISVAEYQAMVRDQGGVCAICREDEPKQHGRTGKQFRLAVDHCHKTGRIRGLLCQRCNRAMGMFDDDPIVLRRAISYLLRHARRESNQGGQ